MNAMMQNLKNLYRNATDFITFVKLDAPDFAPEDGLSCEKAIARITRYLSDIREIERNETARQWLTLCVQDVNKAEKLFTEKHDSDARKALDSARTYLINASIKKTMEPTFIAKETGETQDLSSGFPA
jgi:hypothetical protein